MQDRYGGNIADYGKFAMLLALAAGGFSISINWYRTETLQQEQSVNDGKKLIPDSLVVCDPMLADALRCISVSDDRSIKAGVCRLQPLTHSAISTYAMQIH